MSSSNVNAVIKISVLSHDWNTVIAAGSKIGPRLKGESFTAYLRQEEHVAVRKACEQFCSNSSYRGEWSPVGMHGAGLYNLMHEVDYEGTLRDGMFHGEGLLTYPMGQKIDGHWIKGKLVSFKFRFADDLEYDDPWKYCQMPDRRFYTSILDGLRPAGRSLLTNIDPTRKIPEGCYDTGDGFYNPETKCVWSAITPNKILRVPTAAEEQWIMENCRKAWDEPTEYKPELFEHWVSGRKNDSVFQQQEDNVSPTKTDTDSEGSVNVRMIVEPTYNVSPVSSRSWWESLMGEAPNEISANI